MAKRMRLIGGGTLVLLLLYLAVFPRPLGTELVVSAEGATMLQNAEPSSSGTAAPLYPFQLDPDFGYIDSEGKLSFMDSVQGGVAMTQDGFINYSAVSETHVYQDGYGRIEQVIQAPGYPVLRAERVFILGPGDAKLSEWGETGARMWERDFGSLITAFDATAAAAAVGLLTGELVFLDADGQEIQRYQGRSSRVPVVYGLDFEETGNRVAVVSGLDPQIVTVLQHDGERYVPLFERELASVLREPVTVRFFESAERIGVEQVDAEGEVSLVSWRFDGRDIAELSLVGRLHGLLGPEESPVFVALAEESQSPEAFELVLWAGADRVMARVPFSAEVTFLGDGPAGSLLLGIDERVLQLRLEEG